MLILQVLDFSWDSASSAKRDVEVEAVDGEFVEGRYRKVSITVCGIIACLNTSCVGGCIMRSYEKRLVRGLGRLVGSQRTEL